MDVLRCLFRLPAGRDEVGGWLLGYWTADERTLVVTHATPAVSRGTPSGVTVSGEGHGPYFEAAWDISGGDITFLGDWHTHPGGVPLPSAQDRKALKQLAEGKAFGTPRPLMAIATVPRWAGLRRPRHVAFFLREPCGAVTILEATPFSELVQSARGITEVWARLGVRAQRQR